MRHSRTTSNPTLTRRSALIGMAATGTAATIGWMPTRAATAQGATPEASPAATGQVTIPDTPIGREFESLIAAVNSRDPNMLLAHFEKYGPPDQAESMAVMVYIDTRPWGEVIVHRIDGATDTRINALITTTLSEEWFTVRMENDGERINTALEPAEPLPGAVLTGPLDDGAIAAEMMRYLDKLAAADVFSGSVLIARNGTSIFTGAYGMADIEQQRSNTVETRFNLGSMNKMFTAVTIGQLVEAGEMAFSDTIAQHLPNYPADVASKVTVEQLLTHTSGLGDFFGPKYDQEKESLHTLEDYLALFVDEPLRFEPGERHEYSNAGFIVLGLVIEAVTGQDYFDVVRERVYAPAGMDATDAFERDAATPDLAIGYTFPRPADPANLTLDDALKGREPNDDFLAPRGTSAGGGYSTVGDLLRFDRALREATLLTPDTVASLIDGKVDTPMPDMQYGYGFMDDRSGAARIVGHGGGAPGISGKLDMYWDRDVTVVALGNYDRVAELISMKARRLLSGG